MRPRVLAADDHALILEGYQLVLGETCELLATVEDGASLVRAALDLEPDVVLLDIGMPKLNGLEAARQIKRALPETKLVFVTMHANHSYLRAAFVAGASGFVLKTSARDCLLVAVQKVLRGAVYVTPGLGAEVLQSITGQQTGKTKAGG
jgi:DNA-binding NarL/FixJ family response regulator